MNKPTVAAIALCASAVLSAFVWVQRSSSPPQANPRSTWFSVLQAPPRPLVPQRGATGAALEVEAIAAEVGEGTGTGTEGEVQGDPTPETLELARSTEDEKQSQLRRLHDFHTRHADQAPAMLKRLQQAVIDNRNVFDVLMDAVRVCSLGQITNALFEVGGQYRRNM